MKEFTFTVKDLSGIHARPAGLLVKMATNFKSDITIEFNEKKADAKRIFSVMGLGAKCGDTLKITLSGEDENMASESMKSFLDENL